MTITILKTALQRVDNGLQYCSHCSSHLVDQIDFSMYLSKLFAWKYQTFHCFWDIITTLILVEPFNRSTQNWPKQKIHRSRSSKLYHAPNFLECAHQCQTGINDAIDSTRLPPVVLYFSFPWWHPLMKPSIMPPGILRWNHCKCQWPCIFPVLLISFPCSRDIFHWNFARLKLTFVFFSGGWMYSCWGWRRLCCSAQLHSSARRTPALRISNPWPSSAAGLLHRDGAAHELGFLLPRPDAWPSSTYPRRRIPAFLPMVIKLVCV